MIGRYITYLLLNLPPHPSFLVFLILPIVTLYNKYICIHFIRILLINPVLVDQTKSLLTTIIWEVFLLTWAVVTAAAFVVKWVVLLYKWW